MDDQNIYIAVAIVGIVLLYLWVKNGSDVNGLVIYRFYRPGCKYCVMSKPEWDKFKQKADAVTVIDVNLDSDDSGIAALKEKYQVTGVPTVIGLTSSKQAIKYNGDRTMGSYMSFIQQIK